MVTITATDFGGFGLVRETLPEGFSYSGSSLSDVSVTVDGQTASFVLLGDRSFTYTADAPDVEGAYTFTGDVKDADKDERPVGGASVIRVGAEPPATPTLEPTATAAPTPTPTDTPTTTTDAETAFVARSPTPAPESSGTSDGAVVIVGAAAAGVLLLLAGFLAGHLLGRRRA